tara:strand:+ start:5173 stop:5871 length:699 start_codon:yes stop_codon:yes gene_type:complete
MSGLGITWHIEELVFTPVHKTGKKFVNLTAPGVERIRFQMSEDHNTNIQTITWGVSTPQNPQLNEQKECEKFNLDLNVPSDALKKFLRDLDEKCEEQAAEHSLDWFGKKMEARDVNMKYNRLLKQKDDGTFSVRVKVNAHTTKTPTNIWVVKDCQGEQIEYFKGTIDHLTKDARCLVMVEASSIWFSKLFGISLVALDILVWPVEKKTGIDALNLPDVKLVEVKDQQCDAVE